METFLQKFNDEDVVFPTYSVLRRKVALWLGALLPTNHGYSLGGLRAGGATYNFLVTENVQAIQRRGRWKSLKTLEHYLQEGTALLASSRWSDDTKYRIEKLADSLPGIFERQLGS